MPILAYLAPPVLGAFIGYITNYVAIRMLFRPLTTWHVFGIRVPMTPGVIPGKRHQLAHNIGEMVGGHLLTSSDVQRALHQEKFQKELKELVESKLGRMLGLDLGPITTVIPERFRNYFQASIKIIRWRFLKHLHNYLGSEDFAASLKPTIVKHLDEFLQQQVTEFLPPENEKHFFVFLEKSLGRFLASPDVEAWIAAKTNKKIKETLTGGKSLQDLLPAEIIDAVMGLLDEETPAVIKKMSTLLEQPGIQDKIAAAITRAINKFITTLGPMAALVGGFLNPQAIDAKVREFLAEKGDNLASWLMDEAVQHKVTEIIRSKAREILNKPLSEIFKDVQPEQMKRAGNWFSRQVVSVLKEPETAAKIITIIRHSFTARTGSTLDSLLAEMFSRPGLQAGKEWTADEIIRVIRSTKVKRILDQLIVDLLENKLLAQPIGPIADLVPKKVQESINGYFLEQINKLLTREVPGLVDSLNIRDIVQRKVDSLDLLRLENLLLSIMQEQFKYINLFGGLLGFVIGLLNLIFLMAN